MKTASSAMLTWGELTSTSEYTETDLIDISLQARMTLQAISPLLAIRIFLIIFTP